MNRDIDQALLLATGTTVPDAEDFADDTYGDPDDDAFAGVGGLYDEHVEREVRRILGRVFGM